MIHCQDYSQGEYCVYCGNPVKITVSNTTTDIGLGSFYDRKVQARKAGAASAKKRWGI